jgi:plasmid replication initiation protein
MPFLVELSSQFTTYSLSVAMSLKSKWSQRMYELCQSGKEQMVLEYPLKIYEKLFF